MCLSDCSKCKYLDRAPHHPGDITCAIEPSYSAMWKRLNSLDEYTLHCLPVDECREFELDPLLEEKEITLSLTFAAWRCLARESSNPSMFSVLENTVISISHTFTLSEWQNIANSSSDCNVRDRLEEEGIKAQIGHWINVDSSCIAAISHNQSDSKLTIRFNSGLTYEYDNFTHDLFLAFLNADSKGRFFNYHIKDVYPYRLL